jgi:hypothetical protein
MEKGLSAFVGILGGFIVLAIWSVALSKNSQGPQVIQALGTAIANVISAAVSPTTGQYTASNNGSTSLDSSLGGTLSSISSLGGSLGSLGDLVDI